MFAHEHGAARRGRRTESLAASVSILVVAGLVGACNADRPVPSPSSPTSPSSDASSPREASKADREALYAYCDKAVAPDPACYTTLYGNNLRAADEALTAPDWFGGIGETTATAQGLTALPVGTTLDLVMNEFTSLDLSDSGATATGCTVRVDPNARFGVVTRPSTGPRGEVDVVEAFRIGNPVIRTPDDLGVYSRLDEVRRVYPEVRVENVGEGKYAVTQPEPALETLYSSSSERLMRFEISPADVVRGWSVGSPDFLAGC